MTEKPESQTLETEADAAGSENHVSLRKRLAFSGIALILALLLCEFAVQLVIPQPTSWLDIYRRHPSIDTYALQPNVHEYVDTGECQWWVYTDDRGFRSAADATVAKDAPWCIGDSFTFGQGVEYEETFVGLLHADGAPGLGFVNAAVAGYGPVQYRQLIEHLVSTDGAPRRVLVVTYMGNDFHDCVWKAEDVGVADRILKRRTDLRGLIKRSSHLYRLVSRVYHRAVPAPEAPGFREVMLDEKNWESGILKDALKAYRDEFARISKACSSHGVALDVVIIPTRDAIGEARRRAAGEPPEIKGDPATPAKHAATIMKDLGIRFVDLTPALLQEPIDKTYFRHDGHFTPAAHRITADEIRKHYAALHQEN